jgi:hypothetical protein
MNTRLIAGMGRKDAAGVDGLVVAFGCVVAVDRAGCVAAADWAKARFAAKFATRHTKQAATQRRRAVSINTRAAADERQIIEIPPKAADEIIRPLADADWGLKDDG